MTSVGQRCRANGVYVRVVNVRRHVWQRKRWRPTGRRPSFFTLAEWQRGQCGILIPSQRKQYQQRGASLAHCNFAVFGDVVVMGHRPDAEDASPREEDLVDERTQLVQAQAVMRGDPERLGRYVAQRLGAQAGRFWVHFDADVFDESEMPAVTYAQPDGLDWGQVEALLRALVSSPALVGLSIADFEPDKDPDGQHARRIVDLTARLLKQ